MDGKILEKQVDEKRETKRISANHITSKAMTTVCNMCVVLEDPCVKSQQENK